MITHFRHRLRRDTPYEYICFYVDELDGQISEFGETKQMLLEDAITCSYLLLGRYSARKTALIALQTVMLDSWGWTKIWANF